MFTTPYIVPCALAHRREEISSSRQSNEVVFLPSHTGWSRFLAHRHPPARAKPPPTICCHHPRSSQHQRSRSIQNFFGPQLGCFVPNRPAVAHFSHPSPNVTDPCTQHHTPSLTLPFASPDVSPLRETLARTLTAKPTKRVGVFLRPISNCPTVET